VSQHQLDVAPLQIGRGACGVRAVRAQLRDDNLNASCRQFAACVGKTGIVVVRASVYPAMKGDRINGSTSIKSCADPFQHPLSFGYIIALIQQRILRLQISVSHAKAVIA
jgi:hypothetical protein